MTAHLTPQQASEEIHRYYRIAKALHGEGFLAWIDSDERGLILFVRGEKLPKGEEETLRRVVSVMGTANSSVGSPSPGRTSCRLITKARNQK